VKIQVLKVEKEESFTERVGRKRRRSGITQKVSAAGEGLKTGKRRTDCEKERRKTRQKKRGSKLCCEK